MLPAIAHHCDFGWHTIKMQSVFPLGGFHMPSCLIVQPIHPAGLALLEQSGIEAVLSDPGAMVAQAPGVAAVITRNAGFTAEAMRAAPDLAVVSVHGTGYDRVAVETATGLGILVVNTPEANVLSVAEHTLALTFALAKGVVSGDRATRAGDDGFKYRARMIELAGATFGVVGFGLIGRETARLAAAIGMRVVGWSPSGRSADLQAAGVEPMASLEALVAESDVVSLHLRLSPSSRHLIDRRMLARMKPGAFLVNTARGALVDEDALCDALAAGDLAGAGLDVFADEPLPTNSRLREHENIVLTPHVAGSTEQALQRMARLAASQVVDVLAGRRPPHIVNPAAWPGRAAAFTAGKP